MLLEDKLIKQVIDIEYINNMKLSYILNLQLKEHKAIPGPM